MAVIKKKDEPSKAVATPKSSEAEVGEEFGVASSFPVTTYDSFSYGVDFQKLSKDGGVYLLGKSPNAVPVDKLIEMRRRDTQTRALLRMFVLPILSCAADGEWIMPPDTKGGEKEVEFANQMFRLPPHAGGMSSSLNLVLKQTLLALVEGFAVFEEVRTVPKEGPLKGKITLRKMAHRNASTIRFLVDDHGGFAGVVQEARKPDGTPLKQAIAANKVLFYTCQPEENPFYGVSLFESAWYNYDIKSKLYYVAHVAAQMSAVPGRIGTYPLSASMAEKRAFKKALSDFAFNNSLALPAGFGVTPFNSGSGFNFLEYIDHHSKQQAKSVLLQFADSDRRLAVIENGGADASADFFIQALESIMDDISEIWSIHLMPKYIDWNFGSGNYPVWRFGQISDSARDTIKEVFSSIVTSSVLNCTPEFMREAEEKLAARLGFDIDYKAVREREEEAAEQQAELAEAQAAGQVPGAAPQGGQEQPSEPGNGPEGGAGPGEDSEPVEDGVEVPSEEDEEAIPLSSEQQKSIDDLVEMAQNMMRSGAFLPTNGPDPEFD